MRRIALLIVLLAAVGSAQDLKTRWAKEVTPENAHREYPRPQLVRRSWTNLNGTWSLSINAGPTQKILVPYPVESALSGVRKAVGPKDVLRYSRTFQRPKGERILLHFGAVDWSAKVRVNGKEVGAHTGGYDPFTFDITAALKPSGVQLLEVEVTDPTDSTWIPRGKQVLKPGGIFYVPTSGIWQTVWMEGVGPVYARSLEIEADRRTGRVDVTTVPASLSVYDGGQMYRVRCRTEIIDRGRVIAKTEATVARGDNVPEAPGRDLYPTTSSLTVRNPTEWSPRNPYLYSLRVTLTDEKGKPYDQVTSYFAFREVGLVKDETGQPRFALNGRPLFMVGPLDQGFWPDGLYTAPSDAAMKYDLDVTKRLGFNMIRKHVKVEPARWYYWCDKMGILVFQDMPSGDKYIGPQDPDIQRTRESGDNYRRELKEMIDDFRFFPSIVAWVPYNEGWGQWKTEEIAKWTKSYDPTRLVDSASGWTDRGVGDMHDVHIYPGPGMPPNEPGRALFLGEFGGLGLPIPGHMWQKTGWGYQSFKTKEELTARFEEIFFNMRFLIPKGLSGAVYTQTTDVETELNGLMTYDREVLKMDEARVRKAVLDLFKPAPTLISIAPTSESSGVEWRYTFSAPPEAWFARQYDDSTWKAGPGGFGVAGTPGAIVRTTWDANDIYLRRRFTLDRDYRAGEVMLRLSHDDDVVVYLDGEPIYKAGGWTTSYKLIPLPAVALGKGEHVIAIHCHQNQGGQYVDAGLVILR